MSKTSHLNSFRLSYNIVRDAINSSAMKTLKG